MLPLFITLWPILAVASIHARDFATSNHASVAQRSPSNVTTVDAQFFKSHGSKRVQIQYGPYTVPPQSQMNGMKDFEERSVQMPCTDCLITWMQADLHYTNGTEANANTNLWLHHVLQVNTAEEGETCPSRGDWFFASGNERTAVDICVNGTDEAGYYVAPGANFAMVSELMNMADQPADAIVTITYEYIPSPPQSFAHVKPVWLDIGGCKDSDQPAYANKSFQYTSPSWTATTDGRVTFMVSHLHDGGTHLNIMSNGDVMCDGLARYGQSPAYISEMPMNMSRNGMPMSMDTKEAHISSISTCANTGVIKPGDKWSVTAHYNTSEYAPMTDNDGGLMDIMGIAIVYFVEGTSVNASNGTAILTDTSPTKQPSSQASTSGGTRSIQSITSGILSLGVVGLVLLV